MKWAWLHLRREQCEMQLLNRGYLAQRRTLQTAVVEEECPPIQGFFVITKTGFCTPMPYFSTERVFMLYTSPADKTK